MLPGFDLFGKVGVQPPLGFSQEGPINTKMHKLQIIPTIFQ